MIKKLLLTTAIALTSMICMKAQFSNFQQAQPFPSRAIPSNALHKNGNSVTTANCVDTNFYVYYKNAILSPTVSYLVLPSTTANKNALGYSYNNTGTITITGLGFIATSGNTNVAVPAIAYLYNVNVTGQPTTKIDSMIVNVTNGKFYYGALITSPRIITTNFAVVFKTNSSNPTHTLNLVVTPAQTASGTSNTFGEGKGYYSTAAGTFTAVNTAFGGAADYEPVAFPIYNYNMTANYTVAPITPICIGTNVINTNTSTNTNVPENYMFNVARFAKKWNIPLTGLDSIYTWNFSDGTGRFISKNQNHTYTANGLYNDSLIYLNNSWTGSGVCKDIKVTPIRVGPPSLTLTPTSITICPAGVATFAGSGATTYAWQGGQTTPTATFAPASSISYSLSGTNSCGTTTAMVNVVVSSVVTINATSSNPMICNGQSSTLTAIGATNYTWTPSSTLSSANGSSVTSSPSVQVTYTVTGASACGTGTTLVTQSVTPLPVISIASSTTQVCSGSAATFTASGATTYVWMPGSTTNSIVTVTPTGNTTYTAMGTTSGCTGTKTVGIVVNSLPTLNVTASSPSVCVGQSATLTANTNGTFILWSTTATTSVVVVTPTITTTYSIGVTNGSCNAQSSVMLTVATCSTTGIDELSGSSISVYPNPSFGILNLTVSSALANTSSIEIFDAIGKLVIAQNLTNEQNVVNTSNLSNGVYIYKIVNENKSVKIGRIVKQ